MQIRNSNVHTNAAIDIDKVDASAQIGFRAYRDGNQAVDTATTDIVIFNTEDYDYGSNYNNSTGVFTCDSD